MGQAKDEIIIPDPELFYSSPLLSLSIQRKIYAADIALSVSVRGVQKNKIFEFEIALCIFPLE